MPTILIVAASPLDQDHLRLNAEVRDIRHALQRSRTRDAWRIESNEAATVDDLRRALLDLNPAILHFSGHGGLEGLYCEDADGRSHCASAEPLARLFHHFKDTLKCVVLNACYSQSQGEVIRQEIDTVIGMRKAVEDDAARKFAVAFYDGVFGGRDFRTSFDLACTALDLHSIPDANAPVFFTSPHVGAGSLPYTANVPEIERVLYDYYNTPFHERWRFTTTGESLRATLVTVYGDQVHEPVDKVQVLGMTLITQSYWKVSAKFSKGTEEWKAEYYVQIIEGVVMIQWEASIGLWSVPVVTYLALPQRADVVARVYAQLDNYYNYDFADGKWSYQSVRLQTFGGATLHGYVHRGTAACNEIISLLSDGNAHAITVLIRRVGSQSEMPLITALLSKTWLYFPDVSATGGNTPANPESTTAQ